MFNNQNFSFWEISELIKELKYFIKNIWEEMSLKMGWSKGLLLRDIKRRVGILRPLTEHMYRAIFIIYSKSLVEQMVRCKWMLKQIVHSKMKIFIYSPSSCSTCMYLLRWPRELNAIQLKKTHASRKNRSKLRKHLHQLQIFTTQPKYINALQILTM